MKSLRILLLLGATALMLVSASASAQEDTKSVQFAAPATDKAPDSDDPMALLANCDARVEVCERDAVGVPFLAAAYMAIWVILLAFLFMGRRGQLRLRAEVEELEARLAALGGADP